MRLLSVKSDVVTLDSFRPQHHSQWQAQAFEYGPLLNMQFQIGARVFAFALSLRRRVRSFPKMALRRRSFSLFMFVLS